MKKKLNNKKLLDEISKKHEEDKTKLNEDLKKNFEEEKNKISNEYQVLIDQLLGQKEQQEKYINKLKEEKSINENKIKELIH